MTTTKKPVAKKRAEQVKAMKPGPRKGEVAVLVVTEQKGVFFGYAKMGKTDGPKIELRACRNAAYWDQSTMGFMGLAATGPNKNCRIGPAADATLMGVTIVARVTDKAVTAWESAPWS